jgi:ribose/xylose/arabinose/galactoside ABC-type transport system permease subunit
MFFSMLAGLSVTVLIGALSGYLTAYKNIPSFISTLGTSGIAMGLSRIISHNAAIPINNQGLLSVLSGRHFGLRTEVWWMLALCVVGYFIMHKTRYGRELLCTGDNKIAATSYGINTKRTLMTAFVICSIYMFFAGIVQMGYAACAAPGAAESYVLNAIVAPIIGGSPVSGGRSSVVGTFMGAAFLTIITNVLFKFAIPSWYAAVITGIIVIIVLSAATVLKKNRVLLKG